MVDCKCHPSYTPTLVHFWRDAVRQWKHPTAWVPADGSWCLCAQLGIRYLVHLAMLPKAKVSFISHMISLWWSRYIQMLCIISWQIPRPSKEKQINLVCWRDVVVRIWAWRRAARRTATVCHAFVLVQVINSKDGRDRIEQLVERNTLFFHTAWMLQGSFVYQSFQLCIVDATAPTLR